jgi:hypothetical protein
MARCPSTPNGRHIPGCGCAEEPAPKGRAKQTTGKYTCCGGTTSHRRNCKTLNTPRPANAKGPDRKVCGVTWETPGAGHVHICGKKQHGNRERHVCEHSFCFAPPPHTTGKPDKPDTGPGDGKPPAAPKNTCRRCGGNKKIPGPKRSLIDCPACGGTGTAR